MFGYDVFKKGKDNGKVWKSRVVKILGVMFIVIV